MWSLLYIGIGVSEELACDVPLKFWRWEKQIPLKYGGRPIITTTFSCPNVFRCWACPSLREYLCAESLETWVQLTNKDSLEQNIYINSHYMRWKLDLHVQYCSRVLAVNMGIRLCDKVPDHIKIRDNFKSFKRDLKSFLLQHSFYSVDEFMEFWFLGL
jgi:hypothetical protein